MASVLRSAIYAIMIAHWRYVRPELVRLTTSLASPSAQHGRACKSARERIATLALPDPVQLTATVSAVGLDCAEAGRFARPQVQVNRSGCI